MKYLLLLLIITFTSCVDVKEKEIEYSFTINDSIEATVISDSTIEFYTKDDIIFANNYKIAIDNIKSIEIDSKIHNNNEKIKIDIFLEAFLYVFISFIIAIFFIVVLMKLFKL